MANTFCFDSKCLGLALVPRKLQLKPFSFFHLALIFCNWACNTGVTYSLREGPESTVST